MTLASQEVAIADKLIAAISNAKCKSQIVPEVQQKKSPENRREIAFLGRNKEIGTLR